VEMAHVNKPAWSSLPTATVRSTRSYQPSPTSRFLAASIQVQEIIELLVRWSSGRTNYSATLHTFSSNPPSHLPKDFA